MTVTHCCPHRAHQRIDLNGDTYDLQTRAAATHGALSAKPMSHGWIEIELLLWDI